MYITANPRAVVLSRTVSFKANDDFPSENELMAALRQGKFSPNDINQNSESIFQHIVKNDYFYLVNYLTAKPHIRQEIINFAPNGKTPLDYAVSDEMKTILIQRGGKYSAEILPPEKQAQPPISPKPEKQAEKPDVEDARTAAAKMYMSDPVVVKPSQMQPAVKVSENIEPAETKITHQKKVPEPENKPEENIDFFDSFEEVEEEAPQSLELQKAENTNTEAAPQKDYEEISNEPAGKTEQKKPEQKKLPSAFKNHSPLVILPSDPKKIDEIIGMDKIKEELKEDVITPLKEQAANATLRANNISIPNGILLETSEDTINFVKALSNETEMPVLQLYTPQEFKPMLKDIENEYKKNGLKTIVLIRGFDKFFTTGPNCDLDKKNFLLTAENCGDKGALLFATADKKCDVDPKFLSSGIFDKVMELKIPDLEDRKEYLTQYFKDKYLFKDLNTEEMINEIGEKTEGFKYSDIENVLAESARASVYNKKYSVEPETVREELAEFTKAAGIQPVDEFNKTTMYDTPEFKRVSVSPDEIMKLDDLGGMPDIKEKLKKLYIEPFKNLDKLKENLGSSAIPDGAIFYGPAGNGKTLTARVLARELGLPFYETKLSDVASAYIHEVSRRIRQMAKQLNDKYAATGEMSVWFFDEFDSLGEARGDETASHKQEVTDTLLQELNNPSSKGYILIAATNNLEGIDPALRRRGRLGNWIAFSNPDKAAIKDVVQKELAKTPFSKELADNNEFLEAAAKEFDGSSMSTIASVLTDAKRMAILDGKDFSECIKECFDDYNKRLMGEFCNKAGLEQHKYNEWDFKSLDELGGMEEVKQALEENIIDIWRPEVRQALIANRRSLPGGVILEGPPGTGKTTIVETLARQMDVPLYKMNYSQVGNEFIHGVSRNVTDIFNRLALEAKIIKKPVMLFFDEAEKFFPRNADRHQVEEVNTYKELMNTAAASGLILVAATNHINLVNAEIIGNPRRMGTIIHCGNPDFNSRVNLFEKLLKDLPILKEALNENHYQKLAKLSDGLSIGNIADTIDKTITQAIKKRKNIDSETLMLAFVRKAVR